MGIQEVLATAEIAALLTASSTTETKPMSVGKRFSDKDWRKRKKRLKMQKQSRKNNRHK